MRLQRFNVTLIQLSFWLHRVKMFAGKCQHGKSLTQKQRMSFVCLYLIISRLSHVALQMAAKSSHIITSNYFFFFSILPLLMTCQRRAELCHQRAAKLNRSSGLKTQLSTGVPAAKYKLKEVKLWLI